MSGLKSSLLSVVLGAGLFWIPDIALHAVAATGLAAGHVLVLTGLLPITCGLGFAYRCRAQMKVAMRLTVAGLMVLGVWLFGPLAMTAGATFSGGGFSQSEAPVLPGLLGMTAMFPLTTFMMSAYDGTLGALVVVTILLPIVAVLSRPKPGPASPASRAVA